MFSEEFYRKLWKQRRSQSLRNRSNRQRRFRRLLTEMLEERTVMATATFYETTTLPIANDHDPFGTAQPNMQTALIDGLHQLLLGRDASDAEFNAMRNKLQSNTSISNIVETMLKSDEYHGQVVQQIFADVLGRGPSAAETKWWQQEMKAGTADSDDVFAMIIASPENAALHATTESVVDQVITTLLDRQPNSTETYRWNTAIRYGAPVQVLVESATRSDEFHARIVTSFADAFLARNPTADEVRQWVVQMRQQPAEKVLGAIADSSEFYQRANAGTAGQYGGALTNLGRTALVGDFGLSMSYATAGPPTAEAPASVAAAAPAGVLGDSSSGGSTDSTTTTSDEAGPLWVSALSFPPVDQNSIQTGAAVQPTLQLPVSNFDWTQGFSMETWFEATAPGVLLSKPLYETTTQQTYDAPLVWIDSSGKLTAGLFDATPLPFTWQSTPLNWPGSSGQDIGPANRVTSSMVVLDGNWHHVAFVYDPAANSQTLYLDGLLQGSRTPRSFDSFGDLLPKYLSSSPTVTVQLSQKPSANQVIQGAVYQANLSSDVLVDGQRVQPYSSGGKTQLCTFEVAISDGKVLNVRITPTIGNAQSGQSNGAQVSGIKYQPASGSRAASLQFILAGNRVTSSTPLSIAANYATDSARYSILPAAGSTWDPNTTPAGTAAPNFQLPGPAGGTWTVGGTTMPEPMSNLYPANNYPQGFQGAIDELAIFNRPINQVEVQNAMTQPLWYTVGGSTSQTRAISIGSTVTLAPTSGAPTLAATPLNPSFSEGGAAAVLFSNASIGLMGATALQTITLTVGGLQPGADEFLSVDGVAIALTDGTSATTTSSYSVSVAVASGTATVTVTNAGGFSVAAAESLLDGLSYSNTSTIPVGLNRTVTLTSIQDTGGTAGGRVDTTAVSIGSTVTVADINGVPRLAAQSANPTFTTDGAAVNLYRGAHLGLADPSDTIGALILTAAGLQNGSHETLLVDGQFIALSSGISTTTTANSYYVSVSVASGTATVTITKSGGYSVAAAQTLINGLAYRNSSNSPLGANRTVTLTSITNTGHPSDEALTHYFNFDDSSTASWDNQTLYGLGTATAHGVVGLSTIANTNMSLPADWANLPRLPGYQAWGPQVMTPFASPSLYVPAGTPVETIVTLAIGDEMTVTLPQTPSGQLQVMITDTQGNTDSTYVFPDTPQTFFAPRTDTYRLSLTWSNAAGLGSVVQFNQIPGAANNLFSLTESYTAPSISGATTQYAYADPSLPGINPTAGTSSSSSAPANYYPTWDDTTYFPTSGSYGPTDLAAAYAQLVAYSTQAYGFTDFCNLLSQGVANPATILNYLKGSYNAVFGTPPASPVDDGPFPVVAANTPQEAVYRFLYNTNLMQQDIYQFIIGGGPSTTSLRGWYSEILATMAGQSDVPQAIAKLIASGQTQEVVDLTITKPTKDTQPTDPPGFWHKLGKSFLRNSIFIAAGILAITEPELLPLEEDATVLRKADKAAADAEAQSQNEIDRLTKQVSQNEENLKSYKAQGAPQNVVDDAEKQLQTSKNELANVQSDALTKKEKARKDFLAENARNEGSQRYVTCGGKSEVGFCNSTKSARSGLNGLLTIFQAPMNVWWDSWLDTQPLKGNQDQGLPQSSNTINVTIPLQSITTAELNYENLSTMGAGIYATAQEIVSSMVTMISDQRFVQSVMSNYGLLHALAPIRSTALSTPELDPRSVTKGVLENASWEEMTPASFHWEPTAPTQLPVADGRTASLTYHAVTAPQPLDSFYDNGFLNRITADFDGDGNLDVAVATNPVTQTDVSNQTTYSLVTIMYGDGQNGFGRSSQIAQVTDTDRLVSKISMIDLDGINGPDLVYSIFWNYSPNTLAEGTNNWSTLYNHATGIAYQLNQGDGTFAPIIYLSDANVPQWKSMMGTSLTGYSAYQLELIGTGVFNGSPGIVALETTEGNATVGKMGATTNGQVTVKNAQTPLLLFSYRNNAFSLTTQDNGLDSIYPGQTRTPIPYVPTQSLSYSTGDSSVDDGTAMISDYYLQDINQDGVPELVRLETPLRDARAYSIPDSSGGTDKNLAWNLSVYAMTSSGTFSNSPLYTTGVQNLLATSLNTNVRFAPSNIEFGHFTSPTQLDMAFAVNALAPEGATNSYSKILLVVVSQDPSQAGGLSVRPTKELDRGQLSQDSFSSNSWIYDYPLRLGREFVPGRPLDDLLMSQRSYGFYWYYNVDGDFNDNNRSFSINDGQQIITGDFDGDGAYEILVDAADYGQNSSHLALYDGQYAAGINGFVAGGAPATWNSTGMSMSDIFDASSLQSFVQQSVLQGGSPRSLMGYDQSQGNLPATMGTNLLAGLPYQIRIPGSFLTMTPARLTQTSGSATYTGVGAALTGWQLIDGNGKPINPNTAGHLFGVPVAVESVGADGISLITPGGAQLPTLTPLTSSSGAWYLNAGPVSGAATSFSRAFFDWGRRTPGYAPASLVPDDVKSGCYVANASYDCAQAGTGDLAINYTLEYAPVSDTPVGLRSNQAPQGFQTNGIAGAPYGSSAGLDGHGNAYDAGQLGSQLIYDGTVYPLGAIDTFNAVSSGSQVVTIADAAGNDRYLDLLGAAVNGTQINQPIVLTFFDGTQMLWTQSFSDWSANSQYASESVAQQMSSYYQWNSDQSSFVSTPGTRFLYRYRLALPKDEQLASITLPNNSDVILIGGKITPNTSSSTTHWSVVVPASGTAGSSYSARGLFQSGGTTCSSTSVSFDESGYSYDYTALQQIVQNNTTAQLGSANALNSWNLNVSTLSLTVPSYTSDVTNGSYLNLYGAGFYGAHSATFTLTFDDGSTATWTPSFSDWVMNPSSGLQSGEQLVGSMDHRMDCVHNSSQIFSSPTTVNLYRQRYLLPTSAHLTQITSTGSPNIEVVAATVTTLYDTNGVVSKGVVFTANGGFDGDGNAFDSTTLQTALSTSSLWSLQPGPLNTIASAQQTIDMTIYGDSAASASSAVLRLLGAGVNGNQENQEITLRFSDGSTQIWQQSFSDWVTNTTYSGQTIAANMTSYNHYDGTQLSETHWVFEYSYALPRGKRLVEMQLPNNSNVRLLGISIDGNSNLLGSTFNVYGAIQTGSLASQGGVDGKGAYFVSGSLKASQFWNNVNLAFGNPNEMNVIAASGQTVSMPFGYYSYLNLLGTGVNGKQDSQPFTLNYQDGTQANWSPSFSDWQSTGSPLAGETIVAQVKSVSSAGGMRDVRLYGYTVALPTDKRLVSVTLPANHNLILAGVGVSNSAEFLETALVEGIGSAGTAFASGPYLDVEITKPGGNSSEVQRVGFSVPSSTSAFTGGTFTLTYGGQTTSALDWDALTTDVQSALEALSTIGTGNVAVSKAQNSLSAQGWVLAFQGALAGQNLSQVTLNATGVRMSPTSPVTTVQATDVDGGAATNEVQTVTLYSANGGKFTLTYIDQTTSSLAWNASATDVQNALAALANIGTGNVTVTGAVGGPWTVSFQGTLVNQNLAALTGDITRLTTDAGLDGNGFAYDAALLGPNFSWYGASVTATPGTATVVSANGQNIAAPGNGHYLTLLGTGVNGPQADQAIQLLFDDGTQEVWTQSFSDWTTLSTNLNQSFHPTTAYNTQAMVKIGTTFASNGGFDQAGSAYDYTAVQQALAGSEVEWNLGASSADNGWRAEGQSLELPSYEPVTNTTYLYLLGASHESGYTAQHVNIILHYSDGTQDTWTQNIYDWSYQYTKQAGEAIHASFDHKVAFDGTSQAISSPSVANLYRYMYTLPSGKSLASIDLPNNPTVVLMGVTVTSVDSAYTGLGAVPLDTRIDAYGGLTYLGQAYDLASLRTVVAQDSYWKSWSIPNGPNSIVGNAQVIPVTGTASGSSLHLLAACTATCTNLNIELNFSDGTTKDWVQSFSSWQASSSYPSERALTAMDHYLNNVGSAQTKTTYIYDYSYALPANVQLTSIQLPSNYDLQVLGMTIDGSSILSSTAAVANILSVNAGESVALTMDQRIKYDGTVDPTPVHLFGYMHPLPSDKQLVSMILPQNPNLIIAGMGTTDTVDFSQALNRLAKASQGTSIPAGGGLDQNGYAYDASLLGNSITSNGATFSLSTRTDLNAVAAAGQLLTVSQGQYQYLNLLGTAVNGAQTQQAITLFYTDGTREVWKQDFSDWTASQTVSGQSTAKTMLHRIQSNGSIQYMSAYLYSYRHQLLAGKQLAGVLLPQNADLVFLSLAMS